MKKILVALFSVACAQSATAQVLACQITDSNGYKYEDSVWKRAGFKPGQPFFLRLAGGTIDTEAAAKAIGATASEVTCSRKSLSSLTIDTCNDYSSFLVFNHRTGTGSIAQLFGSVQAASDKTRDTLSVTMFTCQSM